MTHQCYISFAVLEETETLVRNALKRLKCQEGLREPEGYRVRPGFEFTFDATDARLLALRDFLDSENISYFRRYDSVYTDDELRESSLLEFGLNMSHKEIGKQPPEVYDFSTGCPKCGTGCQQIAPLKVRVSALPKAMMCQTFCRHYLITEPLYQALVAANLTGLELLQVVSRKGDPVAWWQVIATHEMPPLPSESQGHMRDRRLSGQPEGCLHCKRDAWCHDVDIPRNVFYYRDQLDKEPLPDVAWTWERFGLWGYEVNGYVPQPGLLVSPKVFDMFKKLKVRGAEFQPISIIDR